MVNFLSVFLMLCYAVRLTASNVLTIPQDLGKPPLAHLQDRVRQAMNKNRRMVTKKDEYQSFLQTLLTEINKKIHSTVDVNYLLELILYQNNVIQELEAIEQAVEFEQQNLIDLQSLYEAEAKNILANEKSRLSPKYFKRKVKDLIKATSEELVNDRGTKEQADRFRVYFKVFSETLKELRKELR